MGKEKTIGVGKDFQGIEKVKGIGILQNILKKSSGHFLHSVTLRYIGVPVCSNYSNQIRIGQYTMIF